MNFIEDLQNENIAITNLLGSETSSSSTTTTSNHIANSKCSSNTMEIRSPRLRLNCSNINNKYDVNTNTASSDEVTGSSDYESCNGLDEKNDL